MNFSEWGRYTQRDADGLLKADLPESEGRRHALSIYTPLHPGSKLPLMMLKSFCDWTNAERAPPGSIKTPAVKCQQVRVSLITSRHKAVITQIQNARCRSCSCDPTGLSSGRVECAHSGCSIRMQMVPYERRVQCARPVCSIASSSFREARSSVCR